ncbi:hypothetical protein STVIR_5781 [Streptomyces viridochromogenes Tue57]|uniref:Uncharacterized protein n=1 Tax=Streptomyces viridochromogenes Tue57 TaxID=1160705 RepID=L8P6R6_STRVR|nr:hypothetical protein STVIR_5781 [Streptomyces viridochromogenes Tue57]
MGCAILPWVPRGTRCPFTAGERGGRARGWGHDDLSRTPHRSEGPEGVALC